MSEQGKDPEGAARGSALRIAELEAEVLGLKMVNSELHRGVCGGYGALLEEKKRLELELKELRESTGEERFRLAIRQAVSDLKASAASAPKGPTKALEMPPLTPPSDSKG